jgi:hypothetical protein
MWRGRNDFEAGNIHYKGHCKGWALKIETFLGPEMATSEASAIWAHPIKKSAKALRSLLSKAQESAQPISKQTS